MAINAAAIWEARTTGSSTNGGGFCLAGNTYSVMNLAATNANTSAPVVTSASYTFVSGDVGNYLWIAAGTNWVVGEYQIASVSAGAATLSKACASVASPTSGSASIDYSQQNAANSTGNNISTTDAVAAGTTTLTSATATFTPMIVGNVIYLSGGSGSIAAQWRQVTAYTNATTITLDATVASSTGMTMNIGGALDGPATLASAMVASNKAFLKSGSYTTSAGITFSQAGVTPSATVTPTRLIGYYSARGDISPGVNASNRPSVSVTTLNDPVLVFSNNGWWVENLQLGPSGVATCSTALAFALYTAALNCYIFNSHTSGVSGSANNLVAYCEITGATAGAGIAGSSYLEAYNNWIHDCSGSTVGIQANGSTAALGVIANNLITNCSGTSANGINALSTATVMNNTVYNVGGNGISLPSSLQNVVRIQGNILAKCGKYGISNGTAAWPAYWMWDGNAYYSNTSGNRQNVDDLTTNLVDSISPYTNVNDVILSADPCVNAATNDFRLNNTAGGGASVRGTGLPKAWPGLSISGYPDFGTVQHQDSPAYVINQNINRYTISEGEI